MPKITQPPHPPHMQRVELFRRQMAEKKLDGFLVQDRMDQFWLTGFSGEDGQVLVTPSALVLLTDGRFDETAKTEAGWARRVLRQKRGPDATAKEIRKLKLDRLGFEPNHMNLTWYAALTKLIKPARLISATGIVSGLRRRKDAGEIASIREAIRIAEASFNDLRDWLRPEMTEAYVAGRLAFEMKQRGAQGAAFDPIVASGPNASLPHHEPSARKISKSEGLLIDWGARARWYVSDLTRTIWPGSIPPELGRVYEIVRQAHDASIAAIRPGIKASAIDRVARDIVRKAGYDKQFNHALGHGIGLNVHESPRLGKKSDDVLEAGMVVTIEPGIYLPGIGGVRLEDDVLVTETGFETLSTLPC